MSFSDWKEVTLSEISIGNKGNYGIGVSAVEYSKDLYTYLRITDITDDGTLKKESLMSVDDEDSEKYLLEPNDIVFARTGNSTGRSYFYDGSDGELVYAGFLIKFSLDSSKINPKFMRYYTLSSEYKDWVSSFSTGSTRGNINAKTYGNMKIKLPPNKQQDFLVNILSTLDEKIKVNNQINKTLENMAQTIFKQWFVDFEFPNEDGEPYKSSGGEMVESELGMIPKGWEVKQVSDVVKIVRGASPRPIQDFIVEEGIPWVKISDATSSNNRFISSTNEFIKEEGRSKSREVSIGTLILSNSATPGIPKIMKINACVHDGWLIFDDYNNVTREYIYHFLNQERERILSLSNGSVFRNLKTDILKNYKIIIPNGIVMNKANCIWRSINSMIDNIDSQNNKLIGVRDSLLPKLMSGEIRVPFENDSQN